MPAPALMALANAPVARLYARVSGADDDGVQADLARPPGLLDRLDSLIAAGTIGGEKPNAADFQVFSSVRAVLAFADLRPSAEGRPCAEQARRLFPYFPETVPPALPRDWLPAPA